MPAIPITNAEGGRKVLEHGVTLVLSFSHADLSSFLDYTVGHKFDTFTENLSAQTSEGMRSEI